VYRHVLSGNWRDYDPFDAAYRPDVQEIPSPAVCSMFGTFQGWTALTPQGPGDAVFWHTHVVHSVEDARRGNGYSNVMYISSAPWCAKNEAYLPRQWPSFTRGGSPPDFPADHFEMGFVGRAQESDLTPLGRAQLGFDLAR
jgi:hypothetical protein